MRVTRITIDADLGIIELRTGPGGDGDYVLLPLELTPMMQRYITDPRADTKPEPPPRKCDCVNAPEGDPDCKYCDYSGLNESPAEALGNNPFGDFVKGVQTGTVVRGGIKYPTPQWQKDNPAHHAQNTADQAAYDKTESERHCTCGFCKNKDTRNAC